MASLVKTDSFTLPARAVAAFSIGGSGHVTVAGGATSALGLQAVRVGPFNADKILTVVVNAGTIIYQIEPGETKPVLATPSGEIVDASGKSLIVISSTAPSDADGRPDGVVYIHTGA